LKILLEYGTVIISASKRIAVPIEIESEVCNVGVVRGVRSTMGLYAKSLLLCTVFLSAFISCRYISAPAKVPEVQGLWRMIMKSPEMGKISFWLALSPWFFIVSGILRIPGFG